MTELLRVNTVYSKIQLTSDDNYGLRVEVNIFRFKRNLAAVEDTELLAEEIEGYNELYALPEGESVRISAVLVAECFVGADRANFRAGMQKIIDKSGYPYLSLDRDGVPDDYYDSIRMLISEEHGQYLMTGSPLTYTNKTDPDPLYGATELPSEFTQVAIHIRRYSPSLTVVVAAFQTRNGDPSGIETAIASGVYPNERAYAVAEERMRVKSLASSWVRDHFSGTLYSIGVKYPPAIEVFETRNERLFKELSESHRWDESPYMEMLRIGPKGFNEPSYRFGDSNFFTSASTYGHDEGWSVGFARCGADDPNRLAVDEYNEIDYRMSRLLMQRTVQFLLHKYKTEMTSLLNKLSTSSRSSDAEVARMLRRSRKIMGSMVFDSRNVARGIAKPVSSQAKKKKRSLPLPLPLRRLMAMEVFDNKWARRRFSYPNPLTTIDAEILRLVREVIDLGTEVQTQMKEVMTLLDSSTTNKVARASVIVAVVAIFLSGVVNVAVDRMFPEDTAQPHQVKVVEDESGVSVKD